MRRLERVAELRRRLTEGAIAEDYEFTEGPADLDAGDDPVNTVRLSELDLTPQRRGDRYADLSYQRSVGELTKVI